uniref:Uncharacterized protein n=1 Tax=Arundo donax TaxID=35708 RepID=A0A0A9A6Y0_ARUDO
MQVSPQVKQNILTCPDHPATHRSGD